MTFSGVFNKGCHQLWFWKRKNRGIFWEETVYLKIDMNSHEIRPIDYSIISYIHIKSSLWKKHESSGCEATHLPSLSFFLVKGYDWANTINQVEKSWSMTLKAEIYIKDMYLWYDMNTLNKEIWAIIFIHKGHKLKFVKLNEIYLKQKRL